MYTVPFMRGNDTQHTKKLPNDGRGGSMLRMGHVGMGWWVDVATNGIRSRHEFIYILIGWLTRSRCGYLPVPENRWAVL